MTEASQGYANDVSYLRTFSRNLAPPLLRAVAARNGFTPPPAEGFDYCEIGSGRGDSTVTYAAAHPGARFVGVDIGHEHVAFATDLARRGGLDNVRFLEQDVEDLVASDLPPFDFITAHGVLSWISPAKRAALVAFAAAKLKPGGLLFVSYNAMPGWAAVEPLRRLMLDASPAGADPLDRARRGLAMARALLDTHAAYFARNPVARSMLDTMAKTGLPYVVHEYLQPEWHPMYVTDVAREMAAQGLGYVGQLPLYLNDRDLTLPPEMIERFKGVEDRIALESLKDYALNELFRRDVYVNGATSRSAGAADVYLDATPLGTLVPAADLRREVHLPHYTVTFEGPVFDAIVSAIAAQPATAAELAARPALSGLGPGAVRAALKRLLLSDDVVPMLPATAALAPVGEGPCQAAGRFNRRVLEQDIGKESTVVLAAPRAGTGLVLSGADLAMVRALVGIPGAARQERRAMRRFRAERVPKLVQLGVLEMGS